MERPLLGFFSGFPSRRFPRDVGERLGRELSRDGGLVFVSAWPEDYEKNDSDSAGMYQMFLEYGLPFLEHTIIDGRTGASRARELMREASCVFLMGGHPGKQRKLLRDLGLDAAVLDSSAAVLGVSAGAINMARRSLDTKESPVPYDGLGLADITVKPHFCKEDRQVLEDLLRISMELPICAMEDDSAIFVAGGAVSCTGTVHWVEKGGIGPFLPERLFLARK